jgi:hypothetical protein
LAERFDEVRCDLQLALVRPERHGCRDVDDRLHRHARALTMHAHQPVAAQVAQTRAQIQPARVRASVQAHVRGEFLSRAEARSRVGAGPPAADAVGKPVVELLRRAHR